ncbi:MULTISPECIES: hypothetical protein [unclassified Neisseria]|uniref:hypothetical protein n=1 Tax=unclassified Neisseria TaxID=2623750 RepID=UPI001AEF82FA|nr:MULTISPECIES: hypothetical protein [unclassified Neisseria]
MFYITTKGSYLHKEQERKKVVLKRTYGVCPIVHPTFQTAYHLQTIPINQHPNHD